MKSDGLIALSQWKFLWRHWLPQVYVVILLMMVAIILLLPADLKQIFLIIALISDPVILGLLFMGALGLLEKQQGLHRALLILPNGPFRVIVLRALVFATIALGATFILVISAGTSFLVFLAFIPPVFIASVTSSVLGAILALWARSFNGYLALVMIYLLPFFVGIVPLLGLTHPAMVLSPAWGCMEAMRASINLEQGIWGKALTLAFKPGAAYSVGLAQAGLYAATICLAYHGAIRASARREGV